MLGSQPTDVHRAGAVAAAGSFICSECSLALMMKPGETIPVCPGCGGTKFRRASLFEQPTIDHAIVEHDEEPDWLSEVRAELLGRHGQYLAFSQHGARRVIRLDRDWMAIGRSEKADIRIDDPTVSRRHAVIVHAADNEGLRILDDRSLNGVFLNGERVEWAPLSDGDELGIGRYALFVIDTARVPA